MSKARFVGLDVHKDSITIAIGDQDGTAPQVVATIAHEYRALMKQLKRLGATGRLKCCYEAGPTGSGLCRMLNAAGIECIVVAPSLVPKQTGDRVKTDSRDAAKLARFLRSGDLTPVHVPNEQTEAMRDLERAREDAKRAERAARNVLWLLAGMSDRGVRARVCAWQLRGSNDRGWAQLYRWARRAASSFVLPRAVTALSDSHETARQDKRYPLSLVDPVVNSRRVRPLRHPHSGEPREPVVFDPSCINSTGSEDADGEADDENN